MNKRTSLKNYTQVLIKAKRTRFTMTGGPYANMALSLTSPGTFAFKVKDNGRLWHGFYDNDNNWVNL